MLTPLRFNNQSRLRVSQYALRQVLHISARIAANQSVHNKALAEVSGLRRRSWRLGPASKTERHEWSLSRTLSYMQGGPSLCLIGQRLPVGVLICMMEQGDAVNVFC